MGGILQYHCETCDRDLTVEEAAVHRDFMDHKTTRDFIPGVDLVQSDAAAL